MARIINRSQFPGRTTVQKAREILLLHMLLEASPSAVKLRSAGRACSAPSPGVVVWLDMFFRSCTTVASFALARVQAFVG